MKWRLLFICGFLIAVCPVAGNALQQKFDKATFYATMKSGDLETVNNELEVIKDAPEKERQGYEGALLMRKAGLLKHPHDKLKFFKDGRIKLESAIAADNDNVEFHFLRLAIEEHAPKIVKYRSDIEKDKQMVQKNFKYLSPAVQHAILDYCSNSKVLHKEDF